MSTHQRKRRGGAVDSRPARKQSRLLPSSAGGTSQAELIDLEESGTPTFEPEVIDLTGESPEPEDIIISESLGLKIIVIRDDESAGDKEQSQQQPHVSRASQNSGEPLARDDEEEQRENNGARPASVYSSPLWLDENSRDWEQSLQPSHLSRSAENSAGLLTTAGEEEPRDNDGAWPAGPATPSAREDDNTELQDREQSQQHPLGSRAADNSAELWASDNEEEPRDNDSSVDSSEWPETVDSSSTWEDDTTEYSEDSQQYPFGSRAQENSPELLASNLQQEPRDIEFEWPGDLISPPAWQDDNPELLEVHEQQRRHVTLNSHEQVGSSGVGPGANDGEQKSEEEETARSDAQPGVVIRCPICFEFYSEIVQNGQQLVATLCGHIFCSRCLPFALENAPVCPTCRADLPRELYIPIYL